MWRQIAGVVAGLFVWMLIGATGFWLLRELWPAYASVEPDFDFTLAMLFSRLFVGVACGIGAGIAIRLLVGKRSRVPWVVGAIFLIVWVPFHISIWERFPAWYHLFFLLTLAPLIALGARLVSSIDTYDRASAHIAN